MTSACLKVMVLSLALVSCVDYSPKPRGFFRIEPQPPVYVPFSDARFPFVFQMSDQAEMSVAPGDTSSWLNLDYSHLNARLYCGYFRMRKEAFHELENECRLLVQRSAHDPRAVRERAYENPSQAVYGSLFLLDGQSASPVQFYLTDSVRYFFRGALYFDNAASPDSLRPVVDYLTRDIVELMETFNWK